MSTTLIFPEDLVEEHSDHFEDRTVEAAKEVLQVWDPSEQGKAPSGVAATAVYVARLETDEEVTQEDVCGVFDSSPMTVRKQQSDALLTAREANVL